MPELDAALCNEPWPPAHRHQTGGQPQTRHRERRRPPRGPLTVHRRRRCSSPARGVPAPPDRRRRAPPARHRERRRRRRADRCPFTGGGSDPLHSSSGDAHVLLPAGGSHAPLDRGVRHFSFIEVMHIADAEDVWKGCNSNANGWARMGQASK